MRHPLIRFLSAALGVLLATAAQAQSLVTLRPGSDVWWLRADFHALDTALRGIPVGKIRSGWCKASEYSREKFPKELLVEDGTDLLEQGGLAFSLAGSFDGSGTKLDALVGTYETCGGTKGRFFLILDSARGAVRFLDAQPAKDRFLAIGAETPTTIRIFYCFECDVTAAVRWDRARKRFVVK